MSDADETKTVFIRLDARAEGKIVPRKTIGKEIPEKAGDRAILELRLFESAFRRKHWQFSVLEFE